MLSPASSLLLSFTSVQVATHAQKRTGQQVTGWGPSGSTPRAGRGCLPRAANPTTFQIHVPPMESFLVDKHTRDKNSNFTTKLNKLWLWRLARLLPPLASSPPWGQQPAKQRRQDTQRSRNTGSPQSLSSCLHFLQPLRPHKAAHLHPKVSLATCSPQTTYTANCERGKEVHLVLGNTEKRITKAAESRTRH